MRVHKSLQPMQDAYCRTINSLTVRSDSNFGEAARVELLGELRVVMCCNLDSVDLQTCACGAIANVHGNMDFEADARVLRALADVRAAMRRHRGSLEMQGMACAAF
jgi:hypothetical protein